MRDFSHMEGQIRECLGRVVYTHKTHEKMADRCAARLQCLKVLQIVISALTASGALTVAILGPDWAKIATAVLSLLALLLSGYMKGFDPGGTAQKHRDAAARIWPIRESYLSLLTDLKAGAINYDQAAERRDELQEQLSIIYKGAPQTNAKAYADAQKALKLNEEFTFSDEEIDCFLPASLRSGKIS
ncbi:SLATT domain-containing protein [Pseudomonas benzopyrenica]|uniref:SLATT domain-containing protein n=1 Tax=Pseudomonas benzopyrenica TaxID=2993566 RepID=A0ABZ2FN13_9PSED